MELTYTWKITQMERKISNGYVFRVDYDIIGTDGEYTDSTSCSTILEMPENDQDLIPYQNLTENLVLQWVQERLGEGSIANLKKEVEDKINQKKVTGIGLPW